MKSALLVSMDKFKNVKGIKCGSKNGTFCCPCCDVDEKGRYAVTNKMYILKYRSLRYTLWTNNRKCAYEMNKLARDDVKQFDKIYVDTFYDLGKGFYNEIIFKNKNKKNKKK